MSRRRLTVLQRSQSHGGQPRPITGAKFKTRVVTASRFRLPLRPGDGNHKMGDRVVRCYTWRGATLFYAALEEGPACPESCEYLIDGTCGAADYQGYRFKVNDSFFRWVNLQLKRALRRNPHGVVVRLHVSGDFPDAAYIDFWRSKLAEHPRLFLWGHTHHRDEMLVQILALNHDFAGRCLIRVSDLEDAEHGAIVVDNLDQALNLKAVVCPATKTWKDDELVLKTSAKDPPWRSCATCGLCWDPAILRIAWPRRRNGRAGYVTTK